MAEFWDTLGQLVANLSALLGMLLTFAMHWLLLISWIAWWLFAVDWRKAWPTLARGAWAPVVLLMIVAALVWWRIEPSSQLFGIPVGGFWERLGAVCLIGLLTLFCGWLQGVLGITLPEIAVEPVVVHGPGHEHPVGALHHHDFAHSDDSHPEQAH